MLTLMFWFLVVLSSVLGVVAGAVSDYGIIIFFLGYFFGIAGATIVAKYNSQQRHKAKADESEAMLMKAAIIEAIEATKVRVEVAPFSSIFDCCGVAALYAHAEKVGQRVTGE